MSVFSTVGTCPKVNSVAMIWGKLITQGIHNICLLIYLYFCYAVFLRV